MQVNRVIIDHFMLTTEL